MNKHLEEALEVTCEAIRTSTYVTDTDGIYRTSSFLIL